MKASSYLTSLKASSWLASSLKAKSWLVRSLSCSVWKIDLQCVLVAMDLVKFNSTEYLVNTWH